MKRILCFLGIILLCVVALTSCLCVEHVDKKGDGRCDKCLQLISEVAMTEITTTTPSAPPVFPENTEVAAAVEEALSNAYLGATFDIGLTAETAPYYRIDGEDGYAILNEDGMLEFVGIRTLTSPFTLIASDGAVVYSGFYAIGQTRFATAIRNALYEEGKLSNAGADAPVTVLATLSALSLDGVAATPEELAALRHLTGLQTLSLDGHSLGDLSYIRALSGLRTLDISNAKGLFLEDGGLAVVNALRSLSKLERVDIRGSFSSINRTVLDTLLSMTASGRIELQVLSDLELSGPSAIGFGETVFYSFGEYLEHYRRNNGVVTPAGGFSHAIFVYSGAEQGEDSPIDANNLSVLELYGAEGCYYSSPVTTQGDLSVRLYSYSLRAPREPYKDGIYAAGALSVTAAGGACSIYGAGWDSGDTSVLDPGNGIYAKKSLDLFSENNATLYVEGGRGTAGRAGVTDNWPPDSAITTKGGQGGGGGADAIACGVVTVHTTGITARGGKGGRGGDGARGGSDWAYVLNYGFDGGHGGMGGDGGAAIRCTQLLFSDDISDEQAALICYDKLIGGQGGSGGAGGAGYAAGKTGSPGVGGGQGASVLYR